MDIVAFVQAMAQGGPFALIIFFVAIIWYVVKEVAELKARLETLSAGWVQYQTTHTTEHITKSDMDEIKMLLREHQDKMDLLVEKIFDRMNEANLKCDTTCLAARIDANCRSIHRS